MRAVVLVGGFGTRLRPLTLTTPKPMLPVGHVPIIERLVDNLAKGGVTDVTLALGFKPEPFVEAFPNGECNGVALHYAVEPEPLDTAGAIRFAADFSGIDDTFVVANGDVLTDLDIAALVDFHRQHAAEATIHLIAVDDPSSFGVVATDARRQSRAVRREACAGNRAEQPDQRRHVRARAVGVATHPRRATRCRSSASRSPRSPPTAASSRCRPTTTGSTPAILRCICERTSTCWTARGHCTPASRFTTVPASMHRQS